MTTGRLGVLLRRPEQSKPAFLELFFDLVFVLAFFRLSQELLEQLSSTGAFQTLVLLLSVLAVWFSTARFLDAFDPQHQLVQLLTMPIVFGTLVMAAATPEAFGREGLVFVGAYLVIRLGGLAVAIFFLRGHEAQPSAVRLLFWVGMAAMPWIAGARRLDVENYRNGIPHVHRVSLQARELARWAVTTLEYDEPVPEELPVAVKKIAEAVELLRREARGGRPFDQTYRVVLDGAQLAGQAYRKGRKPFSDAMVIQIRTMASDLLRATGYEPETANRIVREASAA